MRLNPLPPALKDNQRYIVFEVISDDGIAFEALVNALWSMSLELFGEAGTARFSLWVPSNLYDSQKKIGIVRTTHTSVEEVRAVLAAVREIDGKPATVYVLGVTGTIKSAKTKFLGMPYSATD